MSVDGQVTSGHDLPWPVAEGVGKVRLGPGSR